jgi:hypothetical protein
MRLRPALLAVAFAGIVSPLASAQVLKPIDLSKQADVGGKNVNFSDLHFDSVSEPTHDLPATSPLSKGDLKLQDADGKDHIVDLKMLDMPTVSTPTLTKANFTAKRAAVDKQVDLVSQQVPQTTQKAAITNRVIRAFTPSGEEELKKQLREPH